MINTLDDYVCRSLPQRGDYTTNPNLRKKVDEAGNLLPFLGNTVVFLLDDDTKEKLRQLQESLYQAAPDMLAQPLQMSTFHMTLHDLTNGTPEQLGLQDYMRYTRERVSQILPDWKDTPPVSVNPTLVLCASQRCVTSP